MLKRTRLSARCRALHLQSSQGCRAKSVVRAQAGWGFTDCGFSSNPTQVVGPEEKRDHLHAFWQQEVRQPMVLLGVSLGGAAALDFAIAYPEAVHSLVLLDPQIFVDGIGPMASLPRPLAYMGVSLLGASWLRDAANRIAYYNKAKHCVPDTRRIGQLHTLLPGWQDAIVSFMASGGYRVAGKLAQVGKIEQEVLVLWGRQDEILPPSNADKVMASLPHARLRWLEDCGHSGHLEQPERVAAEILAFLREVQ